MALLLAIAAALPRPTGAQIRTDGSVGPAQTLPGPRFTIAENLGRLSGGNLFHSFQTFNLKTQESANFTTSSAGISNVISRVTGGSLSQIDGAISLTAASGSPNFYFINPAGVTFGAGAAIDVPGAFHVSTAQQLRFADGFVWHTTQPSGSSLSSATPESFGFVGGSAIPAKISFNNRDENGKVVNGYLRLSLKSGSTFDVAAGTIELAGAIVSVPAGNVRLSAVGGDGASVALVPATQNPLNGSIVISDSTVQSKGNGSGKITIAGGDIHILNGSDVTSANTGALNPAPDAGITVHAGNLTIDNRADAPFSTGILSTTTSSGNAANISVGVRNRLDILNGGRIDATPAPFTTGNAGNIAVQAGSMAIDSGVSTKTTGVVSDTVFADGNAGNIEVTVDGRLDISNRGVISSTSNFSKGNSGNIIVNAGNLTIDTLLNSTINNFGDVGTGGGIFTTARALAGDTPSAYGKAGDIAVNVTGKLAVLGAGEILSSSYTGNNAGAIDISAGQLTIDARGEFVSATIGSNVHDGPGQAGAIRVKVGGAMAILNGGTIYSATAAQGNAGPVSIDSGTLVIDGANSALLGGTLRALTGIFSDTLSIGRAGDIALGVLGDVDIVNGARISTSTYDAGSAGNISIAARSVLIAGSPNNLTSIGAYAASSSSGQTGNINISVADGLALAAGGSISITNDASVAHPALVAPSKIVINARSVALDNAQITAAANGNIAAGGIQIGFADRLTMTSSGLTTSANSGNGGSMRIRGGDIIELNHSQITTSVRGSSGNGGDIDVEARGLAMRTGFIQANTAAADASGGNVAIAVQNLVPNMDSLFAGGATPYAFAPGVPGFNVIQAAAPTGLSGNVTISSPSLNISGSLVELKYQFLDTGGLGRNPCQITRGSSLSLTGRGGLPVSALDLLSPALDRGFTPCAGPH